MNEIFDSFPIITFDEIILREISIIDAKEFLYYIADPSVNKYLSDEDIPKTYKEAETELRYWADLFNYKRSFYWGIALRDSNKLIGTCGYNSWSQTHRRTEISYDLSKDYWGQGIMIRSVMQLCRFAFDRMKVNRIQATTAIDNFPSMKLLDKLGFQKEGILKEFGFLHGTSIDFNMHSLLRVDTELL
jgi:ribosomal-protein-alanine N-acetyltransferase